MRARSVKVRVETGHWRQGGSTITQQLARNIFLTNTRTFGRKLKEMVLALALEAKFSKDQILELYLNRVYFGGGAYGIDAASRTFFGHGAEQLSRGEAAIIAGLVKAPSNYSPTADIKAARGRAGVVINSMVENGFLSASAAANANPATIKLQPAAKRLPRARQRRQHGDRTSRRASKLPSLHAVVHADHRRRDGGVFMRQPFHIRCRHARPVGNALRRVLLYVLGKLVESVSLRGNIFLVV